MKRTIFRPGPMVLLLLGVCLADGLRAQTDGYPELSREQEIRLAMSAGPPGIHEQAEVWVMGRRGFEKAVEGSNGWACLVVRAASNRGQLAPHCLNPHAVQTVLPAFQREAEMQMRGMDAEANDETLLAFLEGTLDGELREAVLAALDADPGLAADLRAAAAGMEAMGSLGGAEVTTGPAPAAVSRGISPWWAVAASVATLLLSVPLTMQLARGTEPTAIATEDLELGMPQDSDPSYVIVLHGRWPDAGAVSADEGQARSREYWSWTSELAEEGVLVAAGDLRWEPGERLGPLGVDVPLTAEVVEDPDYVVGMFTVRAGSYEEALAVARNCPHLRYGGSVSVRRVGSGFVTVPGMDDWTD